MPKRISFIEYIESTLNIRDERDGLECFNCVQSYLNTLPKDTTSINIQNRGLHNLPDLSRFKQLRRLDCSYNYLRELPKLNDSLEFLNCSHNLLESLPELNAELYYLNCGNNNITSLPTLNDNLLRLDCRQNKIESLPKLNVSLQYLCCDSNYITALPELNLDLRGLYCSNNHLTTMPYLNDNLIGLININNPLPNILINSRKLYQTDLNSRYQTTDHISDERKRLMNIYTRG